MEWAAKRALPLTFKWDDSNATRQEYAQRYQETARKHGVDVQAVRHQLALLVNQNDDGDIARAGLVNTYPNTSRNAIPAMKLRSS